MAFGFIMGTSIILSYSSVMLLPLSLCFHDNQYVSTVLHLPPKCNINYKIPLLQFVLTASTTTTFIFFYLTLILLLFSVATTDFIFRRSHSAFFLMVSILYYTLLILVQYDIIHPFGTEHHLKVYADVIHSSWA